MTEVRELVKSAAHLFLRLLWWFAKVYLLRPSEQSDGWLHCPIEDLACHLSKHDFEVLETCIGVIAHGWRWPYVRYHVNSYLASVVSWF